MIPERLFDVGALAYDMLTRQNLWREQVRRVLDHVPELPPAPRVLDIGCGPGVSAFVLAEALGPQAEVVGVDLAETMIAIAERTHRERYAHLKGLRFVRADAAHLPFAAASFDLAVGHSVLYLVRDRVAVLREVHRVLVPGGKVVFMEPNQQGSLPGVVKKLVSNFDDTVKITRKDPGAALRFGLSMVLWRLASAAAGRLSPAMVTELFSATGFTGTTCHPTLGGLGIHCVSVRPGDASSVPGRFQESLGAYHEPIRR